MEAKMAVSAFLWRSDGSVSEKSINFAAQKNETTNETKRKRTRMKRFSLLALLLVLGICQSLQAAAITAGKEYLIWLNIYEKLLGSNAAGDGPALSAYGTNANADSYVSVAEDSGKSGYVLLRQKSSGKYLAASGSNAWSMTLETRSTDDRFCWKTEVGTYVYLISKKNSKYVGIDGAQKGNDYVSVFYDKPKGSHSQFTIIPATGDYNASRQAYVSAVYKNAQGVQEIDYVQLANENISRSDAVDIHLTANNDPITGSSSVNLGSDRTWLIFDNITPSKVKSDFLKYVRINGVAANVETNCRVAIYLNGAAVIPTPSVVFEANGNTSFTLARGNHSDLGENSNSMTSFTLRRGYMATLASGRNGSGYSRVYVADHADLTVTLPQALAHRVTSVNIKSWQYVSKKGWGNTAGSTGGDGLRATWYWAWNADYWSTSNMEYVPCRQHRWWPSVSQVNEHASSATLSINEPEHSEQHTKSDCACSDNWTNCTLMPDYLPSGARIGSCQPTNFSWLSTFFGHVDDMAYRCDFAVTHAYWDLGGRDAATYADWFCNTQCKGIWNTNKRPVWLTEMEISASWNDNKIDSYEKNRQYLQVLLQKIDECPWIERYAIYGFDMWETYMYYKADVSQGLTPAGQVYRDHRATFAYDVNYTKVPIWWEPSVKTPTANGTYDSEAETMTFAVNNPNTDMTASIAIERRSGNGSWQNVTTITDAPLFEDANIQLKDIHVGSVQPGEEFRVVVTTITGKTATSEAFQLGTLINGTINANSFSDITGWTCFRGAQNGFTKASSGDTYFEVWHPAPAGENFDYYQDLTGLANGLYRLTANVFNSSNGVAGATVNNAVGLYAQSQGVNWFTPVTKDSEMDGADLLTIDNIVVDNGTMRVGVRNLSPMTARWAGADNFKLEYLGTVEDVLDRTPEHVQKKAQKAFLAQMPLVSSAERDLSYFIHNPEATSSRTDGWTVDNVGFNSGEAYDGVNSDPKNVYFDKWSADNHSFSLSQTIEGLPEGLYTVSAMLRSAATFTMTLSASTSDNAVEKSFTGNGADDGEYPKGWQRVSLSRISVAQGQPLTITLKGSGTSWWSADHFTLTWQQDPVTAISELTDTQDTPSTYTLMGIPVNTKTLRRGVYIVDGKKVLVK